MSTEPPASLEAFKLAAFFLSRAAGDLLHITRDARRAAALRDALAGCLPKAMVEVLPPWDNSPGDAVPPSPRVMGERMAVLARIVETGGRRIVIASARAVLQKLPLPGSVQSFTVKTGEHLDEPALRAFCEANGYFIDERIDEPGEVAFRGQVIDVYPGGQAWPCRIEIAGGEVREIKPYDPVTQRSFDSINEIVLTPVIERELSSSLPDHLPKASVTCWDTVAEEMTQVFEQVEAAVGQQASRSQGPSRHLDRKAWRKIISDRDAHVIEPGNWREAPVIIAERRRNEALRQFVAKMESERKTIVIASADDEEAKRMSALLRKASGSEAVAALLPQILGGSQQGRLALPVDLQRGFVSDDLKLAVLARRELIGTRHGASHRSNVPLAGGIAEEFQPGDLIVHEDHGIGVLEGIETVDGPQGPAQFVRLTYASDQKLLAPVEQAGRLWRYGPADAGVPLDKLDGGTWEKRRQKVIDAANKAARRTLEAARRRLAAKAPVLSPPAGPYERFAAGFGFDETPDQEEAIRASLDDLRSGRPMDRLIIGDVGFGKTEVALRAAAAAALSGRQVAVVAPTTLLARQHFATFQRRFDGMDIKTGHLSRLVPSKEAQAVRDGLADGTVRIVVATHSLLRKDIAFAGLALVIIDEEQRFGAEHKKKLREMTHDLHVLTMSATPIPQTLQSAMAGLREISVIATAPAARRPVRTIVQQYDAALAAQALMREKRRGGRSFVIVPRIEEMPQAEEKLARHAPELKLRTLHAKMPAHEIDETMVAFAGGDGDVLLSTSIVESGLDIPHADTMLVLRPSLFGITQLHQLRGRVGRGGRQAYCHLLTMPDENLGEAAQRRLGTLEQFDRLGAGMAIANADMQQRGGGEVLGLDQSGHADLIGLDLLQELAANALRAARGEGGPMPPVTLQLGGAGLLPGHYIGEPGTSLGLYRRLARATSRTQIEDLRDEIADRFGPVPSEAELLVNSHLARVMAGELGIAAITAGPDGVAFEFREPASDIDLEALGDAQWKGNRLICRRQSCDAGERVRIVLDLLDQQFQSLAPGHVMI